MRGWAKWLGAVAVGSLAVVSCSVSGDVEVTDQQAIDVTDPTTPDTDPPTTDETTSSTRPRPRPTFSTLPPPPTPGPGDPTGTVGEADLDALAEDIAAENGITKDQARCFIDGMLENYTIDEIIELGDIDFSTLPQEEQDALLAIYAGCVGLTPPSSGAPATTTPGDPTTPVGGSLVGDVGVLPEGAPDQVSLVQVTTIDREPFLFFFRNNTAAPVSANALSGTVTGPDGATLGEIALDYSVPDTVAPEGVGMFVRFTSDIGGPFPAGSTINATVTPGPPEASSFIVPMELSPLSLTGGTVTNTSGQDVNSVFLDAACFDDAGTPLDYDIAVPDTETLPAGASVEFTLSFFDPGCTKVVASAEGFLS